jgi:O-antigen ligase
MPLVLLLIAILPLKQHPIWTQSGGDFTTSKYLGAICFVYAVVYMVWQQRMPRYFYTKQARWYVLFFFMVLVSYMHARALSTGYNPILGPASLLLLGFILLSVVDSLKRLRLVLLATVASVGWASLYVIREWTQNRGWATGARGEWVVGDSNHFAVSVMCAIPLAWYVAQALRPGWERWLCRSCALLAFAAVVIGASRGGLLGLVAAMLFVAARSRKRTRNVTAVLVALVGFNIAYPHSPLHRFLDPNAQDTASETAHLAAWQAGLHMIQEHPVAGIGLGEFRSQMLAYAPAWYDGNPPSMAHNAYVSLTAEMGIPGLVLFLVILATTYCSLERVYRMKAAPLLITHAAVALQAGLVGSSISISFISAEQHEYLWLIIFLSMCLPLLTRRLRRHKVGQVSAGEHQLIPSAVTIQI